MVKVTVSSPDGQFAAVVDLQDVSQESYDSAVGLLAEELASGNSAFKAISTTFYHALERSPKANPSDLWRYLVYQPYLRMRSDQSWKRAGGQGLEEFFVRFYDPLLAQFGIRLIGLSRSTATQALSEMGLLDRVGRSKLDIALIGTCPDHTQRVFGGLHVKGSLAERISDDVPASMAMQDKRYFSPLLTLDMKAFPPPHGDEVNRGELQFPRRAGEVSDKRNIFERDGLFTACFSYNL